MLEEKELKRARDSQVEVFNEELAEVYFGVRGTRVVRN